MNKKRLKRLSLIALPLLVLTIASCSSEKPSSEEKSETSISQEPSSNPSTNSDPSSSEATSADPNNKDSSSESTSQDSTSEMTVVEPKEISFPTTIDLRRNDEASIRQYYSYLNCLPNNEKSGTNLLKNLKPILKNEMTYLSYTNIWNSAAITERDWVRSDKTTLPGNLQDDVVTNYKSYRNGSRKNSGGDEPLLRVLYRSDNGSHNITIDSYHNPTSGGGLNREHVWPQSRGFKAPKQANGPAGTDIHHLIIADAKINQHFHSNDPYGEVDKPDSEKVAESYVTGNIFGHNDKYNVDVFEPADEYKGDIARACFYMVARYNDLANKGNITQYDANLTLDNNGYDSFSSDVSSELNKAVNLSYLEYLLKWHHEDPVDDFEIYRNDLIYNNFQNNRNPFIDFPEWVDVIFGNDSTKIANPSSDTLNEGLVLKA